MMIIKPVSDLRNKFPEIEHRGNELNEQVYLTKNRCRRMALVNSESKLDEAVKQSVEFSERYTLDQVVSRIKERINKK